MMELEEENKEGDEPFHRQTPKNHYSYVLVKPEIKITPLASLILCYEYRGDVWFRS